MSGEAATSSVDWEFSFALDEFVKMFMDEVIF